MSSAALARSPSPSLALNSVTDLLQLADVLYRGGLTPPGIDSPQKVAAVILAGLEVGLAPTQALGSIMLTNGKLYIYGDGALALVRASGQLEAIKEWVDGEGEARTGHCRVKRKNEEDREYKFSIAEANQAGLIERARGKDGKGRGPWVTYPDRMLIARSRGFAIRDVFPDALRGLMTFEEAQDTSVVETEVKVVGTTAAQAPGAVTLVPPPSPSTAMTTGPSFLPSPAAADGPVTDAQKEQFLQLRTLVCAARGAHTSDDQRAAWSDALSPFGVTSVAQLTSARAAEVLKELGKSQDPFSHPATSSGSLV